MRKFGAFLLAVGLLFSLCTTLKIEAQGNNIGLFVGQDIGILQVTENEIEPYDIEDKKFFKEGYFFISSRKSPFRYGVIDKKGKLILPMIYEYITPMNDSYGMDKNLAVLLLPPEANSERKRGCINTSARVIAQPIYGFIGSEIKDAQFVVSLNGNYGTLNLDGEVVVPLIYDFVFPFSSGMARVYRGDKVGYVDTSGVEVIPTQYDTAGNFSDGNNNLCAVSSIDKMVSDDPDYMGAQMSHSLYELFQYKIINRQGTSIYQSEIFRVPSIFMPNVDRDFMPDRLKEGEYLVFDVSGLEKVKVDINGYYGKESYSRGESIFGQYADEPIYEVYDWNPSIPYEYVSPE